MGEILYQHLIHGSATQDSLSKSNSDSSDDHNSKQEIELELKQQSNSDSATSIHCDFFGAIFR